MHSTDTLTWLPTNTPMPTVSSADIIASTTQDILHELCNPSPGSPLAPLTDTETETLIQISKLLNTKVEQTLEEPAAVQRVPPLAAALQEEMPAVLRVPPPAAALQEAPRTQNKTTNTNGEEQPTPSNVTYHDSTRYKKQQT